MKTIKSWFRKALLLKLSMRDKILFVALFSLYHIAFSFLLDTNSIYLQSINFIGGSAIFIMFIDMFKTKALHWRFIKMVLIAFWYSAIALYMVNMIRFDSFKEWVANFNDYFILVPIYTLTVIGACIYAVKTLK